MKITFTAVVDLGDDFCDQFDDAEVEWAINCVKEAYQVRLHDVDDDYPIKVHSLSAGTF